MKTGKKIRPSRTDARTRGTSLGACRGMTLIELAIALFVMTVGILGSVSVIGLSMQSNGSNRYDSTGTMLAKMVSDVITSTPADVTNVVPVKDCRPTAQGGPQTWNISTAGSATGLGANLTSTGQIDFSQAVSAIPADYQMQYVVCADGATYDVRWNVQNLTTINGKTYTKLVTVAAREVWLGKETTHLYSLPVTLRTIAGK